MTRSTDAALIAQMGAGGGGLDITTSAGGDNMKVRAPDVGDTTDVTDSGFFGGALTVEGNIAVGQNSVIADSNFTIAIGAEATATQATDCIVVGNQSSIVTDANQDDNPDEIIVIGDGIDSGISGLGIGIGTGPRLRYLKKADNTLYSDSSETIGNVSTGSRFSYAQDMIAVGDGASCAGAHDLIAVGNEAAATGERDLIAIGDGAHAGTAVGGIGGHRKFDKGLPDRGLIAVGKSATATGLDSIAIGEGARAGRSGITGGDPGNYQAQSGNVAVGAASGAGVIDASIDETGSDHNVAVGYEADATGATASAATTAWPAGGGNVAIGYGAEAHGDNTVALGLGATATYSDSTALGTESEAQAPSATAVGTNARANHNSSTAVGVSATTTADNQIMLGTHFDFVEIPGDSRGGASNGLVLTDTDGSGNRWIIQVTGGVLTVSAAP